MCSDAKQESKATPHSKRQAAIKAHVKQTKSNETSTYEAEEKHGNKQAGSRNRANNKQIQ